MNSLRPYTTMKIGGAAERILFLRNLEDLRESLPRPLRILGNGSNVLIDDRGLKGTVIVVRDFPPRDPEILEETAEGVRIRVSAGLFNPMLSRWAAQRALKGVEYLVGVPGTVGGALVQNAGANDQEFRDVCESAHVFDLETSESFELRAEETELSYRSSRFKKNPHWLVTSVTLFLARGAAGEIQSQIQRNLDYRKLKTPWTRPSLGSVFTRLPNPEKHETSEWLFPGKLIEEAGLKGYQIGDAQVSEIHANYVINLGHATFVDVMRLIREIEQRVLEHSGVRLHREILIWSDLAG